MAFEEGVACGEGVAFEEGVECEEGVASVERVTIEGVASQRGLRGVT